ncbi:MAG: cyanophycin synthetase, partial [Patescibacteria group bacterium]
NLVQIAEALSGYLPPLGRLSVLEGIKGSILIDDTYNASPLSMKEALHVLMNLSARGGSPPVRQAGASGGKAKRKIAVLGDMLELGKHTLEAHESVGRLVGKSADILITVGMRAKAIAEGAITSGMIKRSVYSFNKTGEAGRFLQGLLRAGDLVLIKASQGVRLERVTEEVMAHPEDAPKLLVRQTPVWKKRAGLYD